MKQLIRDHIAYLVAIVIMAILVFFIQVAWLKYAAAAVLGIGASAIDAQLKEERKS